MSLVERFIFRPSKVGCRGSLALSIPRALTKSSADLTVPMGYQIVNDGLLYDA